MVAGARAVHRKAVVVLPALAGRGDFLLDSVVHVGALAGLTGCHLAYGSGLGAAQIRLQSDHGRRLRDWRWRFVLAERFPASWEFLFERRMKAFMAR